MFTVGEEENENLRETNMNKEISSLLNQGNNL